MKRVIELEHKYGQAKPMELYAVVYEWRGLDKIEIARKRVDIKNGILSEYNK